MTSISWTATNSGTWSTGGNWSTGAAPLTGDDVTIETPNPITVTYNAGSLFLDTLTTSNATLSVTAGTLGITSGYQITGGLLLSAGEVSLTAGGGGDSLAGLIDITGGLLSLSGGAVAAQGGTFTETGGTLSIANGVFTDASTGTISSVVDGYGQLELDDQNGTITLNTGFALNTGSFYLLGGGAAFNESLKYANNFTAAQGTTIGLNSIGGGKSATLTLTGAASLNGTITGSGDLLGYGGGHFNGLELDNGALLDIEKGAAYNILGTVTLGVTGGGTISVLSGGSLRITDNASILTGPGGGVLLNDGTISKVGGSSSGGTSVISTSFSNSTTGLVDIAVGTLDFAGPSSGFTNTLGGTFAGAGTAAFSTGDFLISKSSTLHLDVDRVLLEQSASVTLATALTYAGDFDQTGGTLIVGVPDVGAGSLTLTGLVSFDAETASSLVKGTGTVLASDTSSVHLGNGIDLEGNLTFDLAGPVSQTGTVNLGVQTGAIVVAKVEAGNTWSLNGSTSILGFNGDIQNEGTFVKASGAGDSIVQSEFFNNSNGTLAVDTGTLTLSGVGTLGGSVTGSAALDISGAFQFASGLSLSVGEVILDTPNEPNEIQVTLDGTVTYAGGWAQDGGTLQLNGETLSLTGVTSLLSGAIVGPGTFTSTGPAVLGQGFSILQGADVVLSGATEQSGSVTLTSGPALTIGAGGVYTIDAGAELGGPNDTVSGTLVVNGVFEAEGSGSYGGSPPATNVIAAAVVDNDKIVISHGEMEFLGSLSGTGALSLSNGATLDLLGGGVVKTGITFGTGDSVLDLGAPDSFAGKLGGFATGDMVELAGFAFVNTNNGATATLTVSGDTVKITDPFNETVTLTFSTAQTLSQLTLVEGPHDGLALLHL
jgi:hypothetical protein